MFCVYTGSDVVAIKPASIDSRWKTHKFNTFKKAIKYAKKWLGHVVPLDYVWMLNVPFVYYPTFGCYVVIKEEKEIQKVYVLTVGQYDDYDILGVFTSLEKLQQYVKNHPPGPQNGYYNKPKVYPLDVILHWKDWDELQDKEIIVPIIPLKNIH
jgi:hypothetical protein